MKKVIVSFILMCLCITLVACGENLGSATMPMTEEKVALVIEEFLEPQIQAYEEAFGIDDLSVDIQFKECDIRHPNFSGGEIVNRGYVFCRVRDIIICPTFSDSLDNGKFTDEMLRQLSTIKFDYPSSMDFEAIPYGLYDIHPSSALLFPIFANVAGEEYTIDEDIVLKDNIITYISPNANLDLHAEVGDNIKNIVPLSPSEVKSFSDQYREMIEPCVVCNGSGYVKYYYGESDLQAALDGYDPYSVGKCTSCNGKGRGR